MFLSVPPGPWPGQNTAIYRTGAAWASKWPLGPARVLLECPAGPFGPVSGLPGRSKCRSVTYQNSAIYRTGATSASRWPLGPAWVLLECRQGRLRLLRRCPGAQNGRSKPPVQPLGPRNGASGLLRCCWSVRQGRLGLFRCCQGTQNGWLLRTATVLEKAFPLA